MQIAIVHHARFTEARDAHEPEATLLQHANTALQHYQQALVLCPPTAQTVLGNIYNQLGNLLSEVGQWDDARAQFEQAIQCFEDTRNFHSAGLTRENMAIMYLQATQHQPQPGGQRDYLHRAQAYAQAALRDFQHYQGRAAAEEARGQRLLGIIAQAFQALG